LLCSQVVVEGRYEFEVRVLSFTNPTNTDSAGLSCDILDNQCEYIFRFCLSAVGSTNCLFGVIATEPNFFTSSSRTFTPGQELISGSGIFNPLVFRDTFANGNPWPVRSYIYGFDFDRAIIHYCELSSVLVIKSVCTMN